jgi:hypothetical protein
VAPGKNGSDGIVDHFRKKHQLKREELARVIAYCTAWRSRDPRDITRPDDGTAPIENLKVEKGYICTVCDKCRTTNLKILLGHPRQSDHKGIKSGREEVMLQTFLRGRYAGYWIVETPKPRAATGDKTPDRQSGAGGR